MSPASISLRHYSLSHPIDHTIKVCEADEEEERSKDDDTFTQA
jgi:hypothetical protein